MYFLCDQHTKQGGFLRGAIVSSPCTRSVDIGRIVHDDDAIAKRGSGWVGGNAWSDGAFPCVRGAWEDMQVGQKRGAYMEKVPSRREDIPAKMPQRVNVT